MSASGGGDSEVPSTWTAFEPRLLKNGVSFKPRTLKTDALLDGFLPPGVFVPRVDFVRVDYGALEGDKSDLGKFSFLRKKEQYVSMNVRAFEGIEFEQAVALEMAFHVKCEDPPLFFEKVNLDAGAEKFVSAAYVDAILLREEMGEEPFTARLRVLELTPLMFGDVHPRMRWNLYVLLRAARWSSWALSDPGRAIHSLRPPERESIPIYLEWCGPPPHASLSISHTGSPPPSHTHTHRSDEKFVLPSKPTEKKIDATLAMLMKK